MRRGLLEPNWALLVARARHGLDWKLRLIFPSQIRAARALLGLNQETLAAGAGIGSATLKRVTAKDAQ